MRLSASFSFSLSFAVAFSFSLASSSCSCYVALPRLVPLSSWRSGQLGWLLVRQPWPPVFALSSPARLQLSAALPARRCPYLLGS